MCSARACSNPVGIEVFFFWYCVLCFVFCCRFAADTWYGCALQIESCGYTCLCTSTAPLPWHCKKLHGAPKAPPALHNAGGLRLADRYHCTGTPQRFQIQCPVQGWCLVPVHSVNVKRSTFALAQGHCTTHRQRVRGQSSAAGCRCLLPLQ